jgi:hypothetical protein
MRATKTKTLSSEVAFSFAIQPNVAATYRPRLGGHIGLRAPDCVTAVQPFAAAFRPFGSLALPKRNRRLLHLIPGLYRAIRERFPELLGFGHSLFIVERKGTIRLTCP